MNRAALTFWSIAIATLVMCWAQVSDAFGSDQPAEQFRAAADRFFALAAEANKVDLEGRRTRRELIQIMDEALQAMRVNETSHEIIAASTQDLANACCGEGYFDEAESHFRRAATEYQRIPGGAASAALMNCRVAELTCVKAASAEDRSNAFIAWEAEFKELCQRNPSSDQVAQGSKFIGLALAAEDRFGDALKYLHQAEQLYVSMAPKRNLQIVQVRTWLADCYMGLGDNTKALDFYKSAASLAIELHGEEDLKTAEVQLALGRQLLRMSRPSEASSHMDKACDTRYKLLGPTHPRTIEAMVLQYQVVLAMVDKLRVRGEHELAQEQLNRMVTTDVPEFVTLVDQIFTRNCRTAPASEVAELHFIAAQFYHRVSDIEKARKHYFRALDGYRETLKGASWESEPPELIVKTKSALLAVLEAKAGNPAAAAGLFRETCEFMRRHALGALAGLPESQESQVLMFLHTQHFMHLHAALSMTYLYPDNKSVVEQTAEWVINGKSLALDVSNVRLGKPMRPPAWVPLNQVRRALPKNTVLVEVMKVNPFDLAGDGSVYCWATEPKYSAWLIPPVDEGDVRVFDLGFAKDIDNEVNALLLVLDKSEDAISHDGANLHERRTVWPILHRLSELVLRGNHSLGPAIVGKQRWIVSGDSMLATLPWAALRWDDKYLIETHHIEYVNTSRDLVSPAEPNAAGPPLLIAFPDLDLSADAAVQKRTELVPDTDLLPPANTKVDTSQFTKDFEPIARDDALLGAMSTGLLGYCGQQPRQYCDADAIEAAFYATRQPKAIAFFGHGAAIGSSPLGQGPRQGWIDSLAVSASDLHDPLTQCALVLAGANHRQNGLTKQLDDGLLLGTEIAKLDLTGTQLVFLIACMSNRGEVLNGEGLASVRQAFHVAGAATVIAAHWNVPTVESLALTRSFWDQLRAGVPPSESLRHAQLETMAACRTKGDDQSTHPWYWAGLTCTGNGRLTPLTQQP